MRPTTYRKFLHFAPGKSTESSLTLYSEKQTAVLLSDLDVMHATPSLYSSWHLTRLVIHVVCIVLLW